MKTDLILSRTIEITVFLASYKACMGHIEVVVKCVPNIVRSVYYSRTCILLKKLKKYAIHNAK